MREVERLPLDDDALDFLWKRRLSVVKAGDDAVAAKGDKPGVRFDAQYAEADRLWHFQNNRAFKEIHRLLAAMCPGHELCVYCEDGHASTIDHFCPKDIDPLLAFAWSNYFLSCFDCNSRYKRAQFPRDEKGASLLVHPERDDPGEHLQVTPTDGKMVGLTRKGTATVTVLGFDRRGHLDHTRKMAWRNVQRLLVDFGEACIAGDTARSLEAQHDLCCQPHASLLAVLVDVMNKPGGNLLVREPRCAAVLAAYPEIRSWV